MSFDIFSLCKGCECFGRDKEDGYPVCKNPEALKFHNRGDGLLTDNLEKIDDYHPPVVCLNECPLGCWTRPTGIDAVPKGQQLLGVWFHDHRYPGHHCGGSFLWRDGVILRS